MISNSSVKAATSNYRYPVCDSRLAFSDYIQQCRDMIAARRPDLQQENPLSKTILNANSPFELTPAKTTTHHRVGVLLIHGLLDCPFSLRDIGNELQAKGFLCRSILLPGHGTTPADLLNITYHDWIRTVSYGVESLKQEVDEIHLIGYSTGATLSIFHALQDPDIASVVLLSPAIRIKVPVNLVVGWRHLTRMLQGSVPWVYLEKEQDYTKYFSIPFNAVTQVSRLTDVIQDLRSHHELQQPMLMIMSREDETVSSHQAIHYFTSVHNDRNKFLLYSSIDHIYPDKRIICRHAQFQEKNIKHLSHSSIPFAPSNLHYGENGDFLKNKYEHQDRCIYGAYNRLEVKFFRFLSSTGIIQHPREELTYNPDFTYMTNNISEFIKTT